MDWNDKLYAIHHESRKKVMTLLIEYLIIREKKWNKHNKENLSVSRGRLDDMLCLLLLLYNSIWIKTYQTKNANTYLSWHNVQFWTFIAITNFIQNWHQPPQLMTMIIIKLKFTIFLSSYTSICFSWGIVDLFHLKELKRHCRHQ